MWVINHAKKEVEVYDMTRLSEGLSKVFEGTSPMAAAMSKMGGNTITTEVVSVSTAAIADSVFDVPADYKVNKR